MALDGAFLYKLKNEISALSGAHLDKIYQPSRDELVLILRSKEGVRRLLISAKQGSSRVHFTSFKAENPEKPPMFCMLLRKLLSGARFITAETVGLERILTLSFSALNEMGDKVKINIICELIASQPNIIITDEHNRIIDAVKRSDLEKNSRIIQPGAKYVFPQREEKYNILETDLSLLTGLILSKNTLPLSKALLQTAEGISPLIAREIAFKVTTDCEKAVEDLTENEKSALTEALSFLFYNITKENCAWLLMDENDCPVDFSFMEINQYDLQFKTVKYTSFSEVLDAFYIKRESANLLKQKANDLYKLLSNLSARTNRKKELRKGELLKSKDREKYRIYGELIKANLYKIKSGSKSVNLENYYDENLTEITIPLNPALSPAQNGDYYFKEYKKSYTAEKMLVKLIEEDKKDLLYFDTVIDSLNRAENIKDIDFIREELAEAGFIKGASTKNKPKKKQTDFKQFITKNGFKVLVGRNNKENDLLTLSYAGKNDIWFHTKNIPGSHTVLITEGKEVSDELLIEVASLAAFHSKAQNSSNVPVDYTLIKNVKKPSGAKAGMVIYSGEKTLFVDPKNSI